MDSTRTGVGDAGRSGVVQDLRNEHTAWVQRLHTTAFHHGLPALVGDVLAPEQRRRLEDGAGLSPAGHQTVLAALRILDTLDTELSVLCRQIASFARRQPGCQALQTQYGVGAITAVAIWAQLGDTRRFSASRKAVRHTGLDVTVYSSDGIRSTTTSVSATAAAATEPRCRWLVRSPDGLTTYSGPSATRPWPRMR